MADLAQLVVSRKDDRDIKFREVIVILDGEEIANLAYGKELQKEIAPGKHTLQTSNRMFKSPEIELELKAGEHAAFSSGNIPNGCFGFLMILQMAPPTIFLERVGGADS